MKKIYLIILLISILLVAGCGTKQAQQGTSTGNTLNNNENQASSNTIEITSSGFNPKELTIKQGDTVTWINKDTIGHWPASAVHPTHTVYPESGGCIGSKFDACKGLVQGESWIFTFNEKGSWNYHDHLVTGLFGKIIVE